MRILLLNHTGFLLLGVIFLLLVALFIGAISRLLFRTMRLPLCQNCFRREVRPSHRHGALEETIGALHLFPFRCHACLKRFYAFDLNRPNLHYSGLNERRTIRA